jgi:hypothetical protein
VVQLSIALRTSPTSFKVRNVVSSKADQSGGEHLTIVLIRLIACSEA